jgi:aminopeptidase N
LKFFNFFITNQWLNEGFATLYEYYLTHYTYPDERWDDAFIVDVLQNVMETDSNPARRAMTYYVENPVRIDNLFDSVAYSKCE